MSGKDEGMGLFRRMARKVAAPARELVGLTSRDETESRATEFEKAEMKAMIERKRRNDYVRKRELDTLRRIRREGLSGDQAQALTMQSSRMDDIEVRSTNSSIQTSGIKAKIDAIERQMVGANAGVSSGGAPKPARIAAALPPGPPPPILTTTIYDDDEGAPTVPVAPGAEDDSETVARLDGGPLAFDQPTRHPRVPQSTLDTQPATQPATEPFTGEIPEATFDAPARAPAMAPPPQQPSPPPRPFQGSAFQNTQPYVPPAVEPPYEAPPPLHVPLDFTSSLAPTPAPSRMAVSAPIAVPVLTVTPPRFSADQSASLQAPRPQNSVDLGGGERVEVSEGPHDALLDEAVIAFAGGDFQGCEHALQALVGPRGERRDHDETWLVLFDLYRAIGQQAKFESITMDYVERFHRSAPQWFSLPKLLAEATATPQAEDRMGGGIGWVCPAMLDAEAVTRLEALSMQLPSPWVMDWTALATVDVEGASRLRGLFSSWSTQPITMQWIAGDRLLSTLLDLAPTGVRDADPVYWMLRLEALRLTHRPDQFDEVAIDYCVTFEVSPPSWETSRCRAQLIGGSNNTRTLSLSVVGEAVTSFMDTSMGEDDSVPAPVQVTSVELAGQLAGDLGELLARLTQQAGESRVIRISCALLMRVDFVAAGDLLNWVATRHSEGREIVFHETHRLVALMFGAMGINETARVQLRHS